MVDDYCILNNIKVNPLIKINNKSLLELTKVSTINSLERKIILK